MACQTLLLHIRPTLSPQVAGKKADLVERLEAYVRDNEDSPEEQALAEERAASPPGQQVGGDEGEGKEEAEAEQLEDKEAPASAEKQVPPAAEEAPAAGSEPVQAAASEPEPEPMEEEKGRSPAPAVEQPPGQPAGQPQPAAVAEGRLAQAEEPREAVASPAGALDVEIDYGEESEAEEAAVRLQPGAEPGEERKRKRTSDAGDAEAAATGATDARVGGAGSADRPLKVPRTSSNLAVRAEKGESVPADQVPAAEQPATRALLIQGFVRPFTERQACAGVLFFAYMRLRASQGQTAFGPAPAPVVPIRPHQPPARPHTLQVRELLSESGRVLALWMPSIKTHAYVIFENK